MTGTPSFGVVILTQGLRPGGLRQGLESILAQTDVEMDIVVVGNGFRPQGLPDGVRQVALAANTGIPSGRNAGADEVKGEVLFFLDDDARLRDLDTFERIARMFAEHPDLGAVQSRVMDPDGRPAPRCWTPRLHVGDPARSGNVAALWEGAVAVRRSVFEAVGGWAGEFFYMHEGIDLAWAVWDAGARVYYAGDLVCIHPAREVDRHPDTHRQGWRNRVFLARRRLPVPIAVLYLLCWAGLTLAREHDRHALAECWRGAVAGFRDDAGARRPMSWTTVWRLTRAGRPPVV